jgi:hypothetical protein
MSGISINSRQKARRRFAALLLLTSLAGFSVVDWLSEGYPLSDAHWDSSIYLYKARAFAEGGFLDAFRDGAFELHEAVLQGVYPTPYWSFVRLGHIALMGTIVAFTGPTLQSISVLTWVYRALLAFGLLLSVLLTVSTIRVLRPTDSGTRIHVAVAVSLLLYLASSIATYLSGNLVSEVPAIALLSLSAWSLVKAWKDRSPGHAVVSGIAAFMLYVVRMESIWIYLALLAAVAWHLLRSKSRGEFGWTSLMISALTAAALFLVYSWIFFPLTDPRLALAFSEATARYFASLGSDPAGGSPFRISQQLVAGGGLLWVGFALGLPSATTNRAYQLGLLWLLLSLVPVGIATANGVNTQTRMYATFTPVLFLLSALGWSRVISTSSDNRLTSRTILLLLACSFLVLISHPVSFSILRTLPGMWRLQFVRDYLVPAPHESIDYHLPELVSLESAIAKARQPFVLLASPEMQRADDIMLIQYLYGTTCSSEQELCSAMGRMDARNPLTLRVHLAANLEQDLAFLDSLRVQEKVLLVRKSTERDWSAAFSRCGTVVDILTTAHYSLSELVRSPCEAVSGSSVSPGASRAASSHVAFMPRGGAHWDKLGTMNSTGGCI